MSSIIKGERIRSQSIINLSERFQALHIEYVKDEIENKALEEKTLENETSEYAMLQEVLPHEEDQGEVLKNTSEELLIEAKNKAKSIIQEAQQQAEVILAEALKKAQEIECDANTRKTQLLGETQSETQAIIENAHIQAEAIRLQAEEEKRLLMESTESEFTGVLQKLLGHIISEEVFNNTQWLMCLVKKMIAQCSIKEPITIGISTKLFNELTEIEKIKIEKLGEHITLEARTTLSDTSCLVETNQGNIYYDVIEGLERVISEVEILDKLS